MTDFSPAAEGELWLRFLGDPNSSESRPTLWQRRTDGSFAEIKTNEAQRRVLRVLGLARGHGHGSHTVTGLPLVSSQDLQRRVGVGHRSSVSRPFRALERTLGDAGLAPERFLVSPHGFYGLDNVRVDVRELLEAREPGAVDAILRPVAIAPARLGVRADAMPLLGPAQAERLRAILTAAQERWDEELQRGQSGSGHDHRTDAEAPGPLPKRSISSRRAVIAGGTAAALIVVALAVWLTGALSSAKAVGRHDVAEYAGGPTRTWTDFSNAGGRNGRPLIGGQRVRVTCRLRGYVVKDGDAWWYRIGSAPWDARFYASADAFYNEGSRRTGSLIGSKFVDTSIALC